MLASKNGNRGMPWKLLAIEALLIVLSVLLALGLNSWRESAVKHDRAVRSLQGLVDEFEANCERIQSFQDYHRAVAEGERPSEGIQVGLIRNNAWESARAAGAALNVDYEVAETAGKVYAYQGDHRESVRSYMQAVFNSLAGTRKLEQAHGDADVAVIRELVRIQDDLLEQYQRFKASIAEHYRGEVDASGLCM